MDLPALKPFNGSFSYKATPEGGQKFFRLQVGAVTYYLHIRKLTDVAAQVSFVDIHGHRVAWPQNATVSQANGQVMPAFGDVAIIFWSESYAVALNGQALMYINNQRQQAIGRAAGVPIAGHVVQPVIVAAPPPPPAAQVINGVPVVNVPVVEEEDEGEGNAMVVE